MSTVEIILATYNGERYLQGLLDSIINQDFHDWSLIVADDCSQDETYTILDKYRKKHSNISVFVNEKNRGVIKNFEFLLSETTSEYIMFCDQDDVWFPYKISKTFQYFKEIEEKSRYEIPILIYSDLVVVDKDLRNIHNSFWNHSKLKPDHNTINKLLLRNVVTGCTVMINRKLLELATPFPDNIKMFDWWLAMVASVFGEISYIEKPLLNYRVHQYNNVGIKKKSVIRLLKKMISGTFESRLFYDNFEKLILQAESFYNKYNKMMDSETRQMIRDFIAIRELSFLKKRRVLLRHSLWANSLLDNIELLIRL